MCHQTSSSIKFENQAEKIHLAVDTQHTHYRARWTSEVRGVCAYAYASIDSFVINI